MYILGMNQFDLGILVFYEKIICLNWSYKVEDIGELRNYYMNNHFTCNGCGKSFWWKGKLYNTNKLFHWNPLKEIKSTEGAVWTQII